MLVRDTVALAVDDAGVVFLAAIDGSVAVLEGTVVKTLEAPFDAAIVALAPRPGGGALAACARTNRLLGVGVDGRWTELANAGLPSPAAIAVMRGAVWWIGLDRGSSVVVVDDAGSRRVERSGIPFPRILSAAGAPDSGCFAADANLPVLVRIEPSGRVVVVAGRPDEPGADDGDARAARFARIGALAAVHDGCAVADGARVRVVGANGDVRTLAGSAPGFSDGSGDSARFGTIRALGFAPDGALFVADPDNLAIRRVDPNGLVTTVVREAPSRLSEHDVRRLGREFAEALVEDDAAAAWAAAEALLAEHVRRGHTQPDRALHPISTASARLGRALALAWSLARDERRARVGAYGLWLVRSEEGLAAPAGDAMVIADALAAQLEGGQLDDARRTLEVMRIAFGDGVRHRDRRAVVDALGRTPAVRLAGVLLGSDDAATRELAIDVVRTARDIAFTGVLATIALDGRSDAAAARRALHGLWALPAADRVQRSAFGADLSFGRDAVERFVEELGPDVLGRCGAARLRRALRMDASPRAR